MIIYRDLQNAEMKSYLERLEANHKLLSAGELKKIDDGLNLAGIAVAAKYKVNEEFEDEGNSESFYHPAYGLDDDEMEGAIESSKEFNFKSYLTKVKVEGWGGNITGNSFNSFCFGNSKPKVAQIMDIVAVKQK